MLVAERPALTDDMPSLAIALAATLCFATGAVVGVTKLLQILATTDPADRRGWATSSEAVAEEFLVTFGLAKAVGNLVAGAVADGKGRVVCMLVGWAFGVVFVGAVLISRSWTAAVISDLLLGMNQALCWSASLFVCHDVLGPAHRGVASGLVETSGYFAVALSSVVVNASGVERFTELHIALLVLCLGCAALTLLGLHETRPRAACFRASLDSRASSNAMTPCPLTLRRWPAACVAFGHTSCIDSGLMACCLVGLCLNLSTAYAWGAMSRWLAVTTNGERSGLLSTGSVLMLYSTPKGVSQLPAGYLADSPRFPRCTAHRLVMLGLVSNSLALLALAALTGGEGSVNCGETLETHRICGERALTYAAPLAFMLGVGTACAYSPVLACVAARANEEWRASALGAYRFWRDLGYAVGGLLLGSATDSLGGPVAAPLLAALALLLAALVFARAYTTPSSEPDVSDNPDRSFAWLAEEVVVSGTEDAIELQGSTSLLQPSNVTRS